MPNYKVKWDYTSSLGGPWIKGDVIEMDEAKAEAVNKDSPGVLTRYKGKQRAMNLAPQDRMVKRAKTRKDQGPGTEEIATSQTSDKTSKPVPRNDNKGEITKADFKAVKDG